MIQHLAKDEPDVVRLSALLRGTESAWQAVSYGLESVKVFARFGGVYLNFGLWAVALLPAWLVLRHYGVTAGFSAEERAEALQEGPSETSSTTGETVQVDKKG